MPVVPPLDTSRYYLYKELADYLHTAEDAARHLVRLYSVGTSYEGRAIYLVEVTNRATGEGREKPAIWVDGNLHGSELIGSSACLELVRQLTSNYGRDPVVTELLDRCTFYIAPRLSPDGAEHCLITGELTHSGTRPYPLQPDNPGLHPGDVNDDGRVLQMRQQDPLGEWKISRRDPRLLVRRGPDDRVGPFYKLYVEGFLDSHEGPVRVAPPRSRLDFDRNFPQGWAPEDQLPGAGPYPLSEPETRAVVDFFRTHANLCVAVTASSMGGLIRFPSHVDGDKPLFRDLGRRLEEVSGYTTRPLSGEGAGSLLEWAYHQGGVLAFRPELWSFWRTAGLEVDNPAEFMEDRPEPESIGLLRWLDREGPAGFAPWTPFDHPQLGRVEIGGWDVLHSWINPPPGRYIQEESERFVRIVLTLASSMPQLALRSVREEVLGWSEFTSADPSLGDFLPLRKITVEVENRGYLPTWICHRSRQLSLAAPLELRLNCDPETQIVFGKALEVRGHLHGSSAAASHDSAWTLGIGEQQRQNFEWLVRGAGIVQVEARQDRAGVVVANTSPESPAQIQVVEPVTVTAALPPPPPPPPVPQRPAARAPQQPAPPAPPPTRPATPVARPQPARAAQPLAAPPTQQAPAVPIAPHPGHAPAAHGHPGHPQLAHPGHAPAAHGHTGSVPPAHAGHPAGHPPGHPTTHPQRPAAAASRPGLVAKPGGPQPQAPAATYGNRPVPGQPAAPAAAPAPAQPAAAARRPTGGLGAPLSGTETNVFDPAEPAQKSGGRVLGSPPAKPGATAPPNADYATRVQEVVSARQSGEDNIKPLSLPKATSSSPREDSFSPGLPIRQAYPTGSLAGGRPAEPPPTTDFEDVPPEAPIRESRIPAPLLLRQREKGK